MRLKAHRRDSTGSANIQRYSALGGEETLPSQAVRVLTSQSRVESRFGGLCERRVRHVTRSFHRPFRNPLAFLLGRFKEAPSALNLPTHPPMFEIMTSL
jgi:hypothetical protein